MPAKDGMGGEVSIMVREVKKKEELESVDKRYCVSRYSRCYSYICVK